MNWAAGIMIMVALGTGMGVAPAPAQSNASPQISDARTACASDIQKLCAGVPSGGGRVLACLKQHKDEVSEGCKRAVMSAMGQPSGGANPAVSPAPATASPASPPVDHHEAGPAANAPSSSPSKHISHPSSSASSASKENYFRMQQVKLIDQGLGNGKPAYDLMIPTDWKFRGFVNVNVADGGCFSDFFSAYGEADSPDNSLVFQILPQSSYQYTDDPIARRQMDQMNQNDQRVGLKACPVVAPVNAADYLRQQLIPKHLKDRTIVSVDDFPELNQYTRQRLGLPPLSAATSVPAGVNISAARARIEWDDKGQPAEAWVAAVVITRSMPSGGRGASYNWRALNTYYFKAPKGQLEANDRIFKLILSTVRAEPDWQKFSNGVIAQLYQKKAEELAKQRQIIAQFQQHAADVINGETANMMAGANQAAFGADQLIRGVQTYRDPSTGNTFEMSNQYDHAWLNGANEYVMSDNPNFNPNGNLTGNWTQLETVRPQP
jgi:hypothetical protein